jgi:PAS domain S-box-containing protein
MAALLAALWGFVGFWCWSQYQNVIASGRVTLEQLTSAVEEQTLRLFKQAETSMVAASHWMAEHPDLDPGETPAFIALVNHLRQVSGDLLDLRMVSKDGGLFYIPKRGPEKLADVRDRDYWQAQQNPATRGLFIGNPLVSRVTGKWGIPVSIPIEKAGGNIGVLFTAIELDRIGTTFEAERIKPGGAISIMRADGTFLFRTPSGAHIIGRSIAGSGNWDRDIAPYPRGSYISDGVAVGTGAKLVSFARLKDYPLYVTVTCELDDLLVPWRREAGILVILTLLVSAAALVLARVLLKAMKAQERAQREIQRAHRDASLILDCAGEGICGIDAAGAISFMNPAGRRMLGLEDRDPIGLFLHPTTHHSRPDGSPYPESDCPVLKTLTDGQTREVSDEVFWRAEGTSFPVEFVVSAELDDGVVAGAVMVFRDVAERRDAERALRIQACELERSNADLEQFAYVASHDLREPLRQVSSYVSLLERRYGQSLDQDGRDFINFAREGAQRMNQLVIDLLEFSRIGHDKLPLEVVPLSEVTREAIALLRSTIADSGAVVRSSDDLPAILAVRAELVRLFQNLIGNAIKYRSPDRVPEVEISAHLAGSEWVIQVADNGIGIDPEFRDKIFGIFQRLHTRDKFEGTGIGLAICKKIVERMGGRIWVESRPGAGSIFLIALPLAGS